MKDKSTIKRKLLTDRTFPSSDQINQLQNFNRLNSDYGLMKKIMIKKIIGWGSGIFAVAVTTAVVVFNQLQNNNGNSQQIVADTTIQEKVQPFIAPPIAGKEIPFDSFKISVKEGGTIYYKTGSSIKIPANAFINSESAMSDSVTIKYREFHNPLEIFLSGISMKYDSAGTSYTFESAGMLEIRAYDGNNLLAINPKTPIEINMASDNDERRFNLYELDTVNKNWVCLGKDKIKKASNEPVKGNINTQKKEPPFIGTASVKPVLADPKKYCFKIGYEKNEFPELAAYENVQFEVTDSKFKPAYYKINWDKISVYSAEEEGAYLIKLQKADTAINVSAKPVFDKENYEKALSAFEKKHKQSSKERDEKEFEKKSQLTNINKSLSSYNRNNVMTVARNLVGAVRSFFIARTGIYNCDYPLPPAPEIQFANNVKEAADDAKKISYNTIFLVEKGKNAVFRFSKGENIRLNSDAKNLMWTITDKNEIAFFRITDFRKLANGTEKNIVPVVQKNQELAFQEIKEFYQ